MKSISNQMSEKESILTSISDNLPDGMIYRLVTNDKGDRKFTYLGGSFQKIYGHTPEEGMADPSLVFGRVLKEDVQSLLDAEAESKKKLSTYRCEVRMKNPDGTIRFSRFVSTPKVMADGSLCWDGLELDITDLKKAEANLQRSNFLLQSISDGSPDIVFAKDLDGRILFANSELAKRTHLSQNELLGKTDFDIFPPDQAEKKMEMDLDIIKSGKTHTYEEQLTISSGNIVFLTTKGPIKDAEGKTIGLFGIAVDITELKKTQADLKKSQFLLESITDGTPDIIFAKDIEGCYQYVNSALLKVKNLKREEILGKNDFYVFSSDEAHQFSVQDYEVMESGKTLIFEEQLSTSSGNKVFLTTKGPIKDAQGKIVGLFGIARDVTDLKKVQTDLKKSQFLMQSITDGLPDSIFAKDLNGNFTFVNSALTKRFNKSTEELLGNDVGVVFSPEVSNVRKAMDIEIIKDGKTRTFEEIDEAPSGSIAYLATKGAIKDELGNTIGLFGIDRDITALKKTQEELQKSQFLLQSITDGLPDSIFAKDLKGHFIFVNSAVGKRANMTLEDLLGKDNSVMFPPDQAKKTWEKDLEVMKSGKIQTFEEILTTPLGSFVNLTTKGPIKDAQGKTVGLFGIARDITELKKAQADLKQSQFLLQSITEGSPDGIFAKDLSGRYLFVNSAFAKRLYKKPEELIGKDNREAISLEQANKATAMDLEVIESENTLTVENQITIASGEIVVLTTKGPIKDANSKVVGVFGISRDITESKRAQEALRVSQEKFEFAFNSSPNAILIQDIRTGKYTEANASTEKIFGYSQDEVVGKTSLELNLYKDIAVRKRAIEVFNDQGYIRNMEVIGLHASGTELHLLLTVQHHYIDNKPFMYIDLQDVTEQKRREEALRISQKKFEFAFNSSPDAISIQDEQTGKFMEVNVSTSKVFGFSQEEFFSKTPLELNLYKDVAFREKVHEILEAQGTVRNMEVLCLDKSGEDVPILLTVERHFVDNKPVLFINGHDVRERKQVELQLQKLNLDKDRFISILGHDLRGPVNGIVGLLDLMHENIADMDIEEIKEIADLVYLSAKKTSNLLDDVLSWATAKSGKMKFSPQIVNFEEDCRGIVELLQFAATAKNISIETSCEHCADSLEVYADKNMLDTILRNLISNALKFTHEDGKINIKAQKTAEKTIISIADNGVGIDSKDIVKIFDKSQLFTSIGTNEEKGTGFGLKLCQEFVEKHGGEIWVESEIGKGTTFCFSLPNVV